MKTAETNGHRWASVLGGAPVFVNGQRRRMPIVCSRCLCMEGTRWAEKPCEGTVAESRARLEAEHG